MNSDTDIRSDKNRSDSEYTNDFLLLSKNPIKWKDFLDRLTDHANLQCKVPLQDEWLEV